MRGLNLMKGIEVVDSGSIVTATPQGSSGGRMWRLTLRGTRRQEERVESTNEHVVGDSRWMSYDAELLSPGVYKVESGDSGLVYFAINAEREIQLVKNERAAWKALQA